MKIPNIDDVEAFWNDKPCGLPSLDSPGDRKPFFLEIEKQRYQKHPRILYYADFKSYRLKRVLEIGCGIGTDGIQFSKHGALYTGVELTEEGSRIAKERFKLFGQPGEIIKLNAEELPFPDNHFDHVYSFGVIHHSPHPEKIVSEIYRVLKPGGTINIMLYNRTSFYYLIEVKLIRKIFFKFCHKKKLCRAAFLIFNKELYSRCEAFREKLQIMKMRNPRPSQQEWLSMNTDDAFCPIAGVYSKREAGKLFRAFRNFKSEVWFIDKDNWFLWLAFMRFIPGRIINWLEFNAGWFRMVQAQK